MYNSEIHKRRSIRLKGYDYSQEGLYFITICVKDQKYLFGKIEKGKIILNAAGQMVERWYYELENKFPDIQCHAIITMPNHFHCILQNTGFRNHENRKISNNPPVRADLRVRPANISNKHPISNKTISNDKTLNTTISDDMPSDYTLIYDTNISDAPTLGEHIGSPLRDVVRWFKTMTTNEYIRSVKTLEWEPFNGKLWKRNYYERIIRNENSYKIISNYIKNNPIKWQNDKLQ